MPTVLVPVSTGGRRKRRKTARKRGRGIFGDIGGWLGSKAGNALGSVVGLGRRKRKTTRRRGRGAEAPKMILV